MQVTPPFDDALGQRMNSMFTAMTNIENRFIIHYFDADPLGTGFESLSQSDWLRVPMFTFPEYLKSCVYRVKTPKKFSIAFTRKGNLFYSSLLEFRVEGSQSFSFASIEICQN